MRRLLHLAATVLLAFASLGAHAAISCSVSSAGVSVAYDPNAPGQTVVTSSFTVTCTKGAAGDPNTVNFSVAANNGTNPTGTNNRASFGGNTIRYDVYRNSNCGSKWKSPNSINGSLATPSTGTFSTTVSYWMCMDSGLLAPAGTYTDTVTMTMSYGPGGAQTAIGSFPVNIATPATCSISAAATDVVFNYTAFGPAINPTGTVGVRCTLYLPYTLTLDAVAGTVLGLAYTLSVPANSTGTGAQQLHTITGGMAAGQAGTCAGPGVCTASQVRTLTLTY